MNPIAYIVYPLTLCLSLLSTEELWLMSIHLSLLSMYLIDTQWIYNVFYSISMVSPITPKGYTFPHDFPFFLLYPVTAAVKVPMHDSDLHHAGKEEIARLPTVRQGVSGRCQYLPRERKKKRQGSRLDALLGHYSSTLSRLRGQSRCQRVTTSG